MDKPQLEQAIKKLKRTHKLGKEIAKQLRRTPNGKNYLKGEYDRVASLVGKKHGQTISDATARQMVLFAERYTDVQLETLIKQCRTHKHAPGFDTILKLLPIRELKVRNELQLLAIKEKWRKERLRQTIRDRQATEAYAKRDEDLQDLKHLGKRPRATKTIEGLLGEIKDDAIRWRHILHVLERQKDDETEDTVWAAMGKELQADVKKLVRLLTELSQYEFVDE